MNRDASKKITKTDNGYKVSTPNGIKSKNTTLKRLKAK